MVDFYVKAARAAKSGQFLEEVRKAEPYLERIVQVTKGSKDAAQLREHQWASRVRAEIVAAGGTYDDAMAATKVIEQNAENGKLSVVDIQAIVDLLAKRPEQTSRAKACPACSKNSSQSARSKRASNC